MLYYIYENDCHKQKTIWFLENQISKIFLSRVQDTVPYTEQIEYTVVGRIPIMSTIHRTQRIYRLLARCERLGKIMGTERKMNAVTLGLCMVSGERVGALTCTRIFWACKARYKTGVSHVGLQAQRPPRGFRFFSRFMK